MWIVNIEIGETLGFLRFEAGVQEIFAVQVLRGMRFRELLEWSDQRLAHYYVLPDEALADMVFPTETDRLPFPPPIEGPAETPNAGKNESQKPRFERFQMIE